jgi:hypothetical protein
VRKTSLRLNSYIIVSDSIRDSIPSGIHKYLKYADHVTLSDSDIENLTNKIYEYIMGDLCEVIDWDRSA